MFAIFAAVAIWYYADQNGLQLGYPPFTPVFYWNYTGEMRQSLRSSGATGFLAININGNLSQGRVDAYINRSDNSYALLQRQYNRSFKDQLRVKADPGYYDLYFKFNNMRGWIRYDWFAANHDYGF